MGEVGRLWKRLHGKRIKTEKPVRDYFFYYSSSHPSALRYKNWKMYFAIAPENATGFVNPSRGSVQRSKKAAPDRPGFSPHPYALQVLPGALAPGCRFAGRLIPRPSGKLAFVWSPDAVNDAGGLDGCAVTVAPRRPGA